MQRFDPHDLVFDDTSPRGLNYFSPEDKSFCCMPCSLSQPMNSWHSYGTEIRALPWWQPAALKKGNHSWSRASGDSCQILSLFSGQVKKGSVIASCITSTIHRSLSLLGSYHFLNGVSGDFLTFAFLSFHSTALGQERQPTGGQMFFLLSLEEASVVKWTHTAAL